MNTGFQQLDILVRTGDGHHVVLMEEMVYVTKAGKILTVPVNSESDGASTPQTIWIVLPPFGRYWKAAVLHDWLYRCTNYPKDYCDDILYEAMLFLGVDNSQALTIYNGVRFKGWKSFEEDRKLQVKVNQ